MIAKLIVFISFIVIVSYGVVIGVETIAKTWDVNEGDGIAMLYCGECQDLNGKKYIKEFMDCVVDCPEAIKMAEVANQTRAKFDDCLHKLHDLMKTFRENAKPDDYKKNDTCSVELDKHRDEIKKCGD
ncbi:unnamed protein product [Oppiella nova]|uniref:Uncharacterized protein n=1 Tax=Oppiella nova TaxID=334625 RepID=A0A7R9LYD7_9ACAR|nr:unnamed protein product [Oppiella nova]CAG2168091.1 unnamed protein product [Oppiella nova]